MKGKAIAYPVCSAIAFFWCWIGKVRSHILYVARSQVSAAFSTTPFNLCLYRSQHHLHLSLGFGLRVLKVAGQLFAGRHQFLYAFDSRSQRKPIPVCNNKNDENDQDSCAACNQFSAGYF